MTPRARAAAAITAMAIGVTLAACTPDQPTPSSSNSTSTTTTGPGTPSTSTTTPSASLTPEQQAYAAAEKTYRVWIANYADADTTFDVTKLNPQLVTDQVYQAHKDFFQQVRTNEPGTVGRWTQDIRSVTGTRFVAGQEVQLQVCAVTNDRFLKNGVDVTTSTPGGPPKPIQTAAKANQIQFISSDGGQTWKVSYWVLSDDMGMSC